jgi:hypothetical protein
MTPSEHFAEADRLLASIAEDQIGLPFANARVAKAQVHATLAAASPRPVINNGYTPRRHEETREAKGGLL